MTTDDESSCDDRESKSVLNDENEVAAMNVPIIRVVTHSIR